MQYEVTLKDGKSHTLILLDRANPQEDKGGQLLGLVGQVPAGYKFFPVRPAPNHVFISVEFDQEESKDKKEEKEKE